MYTQKYTRFITKSSIIFNTKACLQGMTNIITEHRVNFTLPNLYPNAIYYSRTVLTREVVLLSESSNIIVFFICVHACYVNM